MDQLNITKTKLLRGTVIAKLYITYGTDIRISALKNLIRSQGLIQDEELKKAIFYLGGDGKKYIHVEVDADEWKNSLIWLTPAGVNLAEKDIKDIGVIFDDE